MCDQTPFSYQSGQVVWVKLGSCWWPGEARNYDELPEDARTSFKKVPVTVVQFFDEKKYEYVRNYDQVCLYNCKRKMEFIQKGLEMLHKHKNESFMDKFPRDVIRAEELTDGDPSIITNFTLKPGVRFDYNTIFGKSTRSTRKGRSPNKLKRRSLPAKQKMDLNILVGTNRQPLGRHSDSALYQKGEHTSYIRVQPCPKEEPDTDKINRIVTTDQMYCCSMCDFRSKRIEGFMAHRKSHLSPTYGVYRPQSITPKRNRRRSEGTGSRKRISSHPSSTSPRAVTNKKRRSLSLKSSDAEVKTVECEFPKVDNSKATAERVQKKVILDKPESPEEKSSIKSAISKKKMPRKRKNEDVFKTQLLADWDDEDPTLLQQEQERIKKDKDDSNEKDSNNRKDSNWFDFVDSGDVMINKEHEERANRFARTRNIPVIPKPDTPAKKQRMEDFPSTSKDALTSTKRPLEETFEQRKRPKLSADQNEEAYAKLLLGDAVPEYEPQLESSLMSTHTENNNAVMENSQKTLIGCDLSVGKEEKNFSDIEVPDEGMACSDKQNITEIIFCDDKEPVHNQVSESFAELTKSNDITDNGTLQDAQLSGDMQAEAMVPTLTKEQTASGQTVSTESQSAISSVSPEIFEEIPPLLVKPRETAFDQREPAAIKGNVQVLENASESNSANVSCVVEHVELSVPPEITQDDDEDDMPEIICVEHRSPHKTVCHDERGIGREHSENASKVTCGEIQKHEIKQNAEMNTSSPKELTNLNNTSLKLSEHSKDIDRGCDYDRVSMRDAHEDSLARVNEELEHMLSEDNSEEVTIIGYRCGAKTDLKEVNENRSVGATGNASLESSSRSDVPDLSEVVKGVSRPVTAFSSAETALIKVLEGSSDEMLDNKEMCVDEDSSSTKEEESSSTNVIESSKADVSREEIVAEWSDDFDEDNHIVTRGKEKTIELIDLEKSENESEDVENEEGVACTKVTNNQVVSGSAGVSEQDTEEDVMVLKTVSVADVAKDDEMELDINSMPIVVEDAVIKDDSCIPPSTSRISVVETSTQASLPPATLPVLIGSATTAVKTSANNIIVVSSPGRQLPQTARSVFASRHGKFVIMTEAIKDKKLAPVLVANSSGLTTRVYTESEQECLFKEGKKTLQQRGRPKIPVQPSKIKPLLPNLQNNGSGVEGPGIKILQSKGVIIPGTSLITTSSGVATAIKVNTTGAQNITGPGTMKKILVRRPASSKIVLPKNMPTLTTSPSNVPQGLKRLTNIFPLVTGGGTSAKQLVISQPSTKPLNLQASLQPAPVQLLTKSPLQPLKKARRMFTCQSPSKQSPPLKSVPTTTIEISVSGVQTTQPAVTLAPTIQRGVNVSAIPRIPSSTIALPGTPVSTASSLVVGSQDSPSFVFIVDPANIQSYDTSSNILNYDASSVNATSQQVYLEPSSLSSSNSLDSMVITLDGSSDNAATSSVFKLSETPRRSPASGQDILATALANTHVFQPESCVQDTLAVVSNEQIIGEATAVLPTLQSVVTLPNPSEVLETLSVKKPIMATHEVPSCVTNIQIQPSSSVSLHASLAASPSMPLLTDDPADHARSPTLELYDNSASQDAIVIQANLSEEPQVISDEGR